MNTLEIYVICLLTLTAISATKIKKTEFKPVYILSEQQKDLFQLHIPYEASIKTLGKGFEQVIRVLTVIVSNKESSS